MPRELGGVQGSQSTALSDGLAQLGSARGKKNGKQSGHKKGNRGHKLEKKDKSGEVAPTREAGENVKESLKIENRRDRRRKGGAS